MVKQESKVNKIRGFCLLGLAHNMSYIGQGFSSYLCCAQPVSSDIDDVIDTTGDLPIAVLVAPGAVTSEVIARVG